jgi:hypothetical protein
MRSDMAFSFLDEVDFDVDVAAHGLGIGAGAIGGIDQRLGEFPLQARQADIEPRLQQIGPAGHAQIDFGIHRSARRERDFALFRLDPHCAEEAGGPAGGEELLGIGAAAGGAGRG